MTITSSLPSIESTNLIADPSTEPVEDKQTMDEQPDKISQLAIKRFRTKRQQYSGFEFQRAHRKSRDVLSWIWGDGSLPGMGGNNLIMDDFGR